MKLWLLRPGSEQEAWEPWYDKNFGFVIRAETEERARQIANEQYGGETISEINPYILERDPEHKICHPWLDPMQSNCEELLIEGVEELIIHDFASA